MILKSQKLRPFIVLLFVFSCLGLIVYVTGLLDYIPQLRVSAKSPNGELTVKVYQKRLFPRPFFPRMGAIAKIYDKNDNLIYENIIYHNDDWDDTIGDAYKEISFIGEEIHISPGTYVPDKAYVIRKSDLK